MFYVPNIFFGKTDSSANSNCHIWVVDSTGGLYVCFLPYREGTMVCNCCVLKAVSVLKLYLTLDVLVKQYNPFKPFINANVSVLCYSH
uniref:Uncharacterized protein n=1 Tax=Pyxicephalus adspersus TaxID=30357 RepID=A0AAV3A495_PYXAD|nr:TPA: hypothetical protein GDO54_010173 [Pyxicephalus adspersus]